MNVYFSDYFGIDPLLLEEYGALNISLINDLPLFVDPFLLFNSEKEQYRKLHDDIINYLRFLREISSSDGVRLGLIKSWYLFPEIKQNWLGYSKVGNGGSGLGHKFANALNANLNSIFNNFGKEEVTKGSHLEKLCLVKEGVGRDNISDFTMNLIKGFLCEYTQDFAKQHIGKSGAKKVSVRHVLFNYKTRSWEHGIYYLPYIDGDYVLLTPKDILTKDDTWINKHDLIGDFDEIAHSLPNAELRAQVNEYFLRLLPDNAKKKDIDRAAARVYLQYPELIDHYIRYKEDHGNEAEKLSASKVKATENLFIEGVEKLIRELGRSSEFFEKNWDTFEEAYQRVVYLKQVIEKNDGYRFFYVKGEPVKRESDLQLIFRLTWFASPSDVNSEVNNGRGPVDYKISRGDKDKTLVEFKLASNSKLKANLENQVKVYEQANNTRKSIKVILYFDDTELNKLLRTLKELNLNPGKELILIDARKSNKPSGSNA
ncbi:hypothetical protein [Methylomagnum ishizawai]|uniref:hypothetical protein n=1 Tax=Methylomagnum ishizawai TaxID=1760988 RepID=UPI001C3375DF|nr:hypothetical protein [Methylomagnum ishizawai]BBL75593.1 hypothetical protein MishRS11D_26910 [Methylomagnum ishizawai]